MSNIGCYCLKIFDRGLTKQKCVCVRVCVCVYVCVFVRAFEILHIIEKVQKGLKTDKILTKNVI